LPFVCDLNNELEVTQLNTLNHRKDIQDKIASYEPIDVHEPKPAESQIIKMVQSEAFPEELQLLEEVKSKKQGFNRDIGKDEK